MGQTDRAKPSLLRIAAAFVIAPTAPVLLVSAVFVAAIAPSSGLQSAALLLFFVFFFAAWIAYLPTLLIGVPVYLMLRNRVRLSPWSGAITGALIASAGMTAFALGPTMSRGYSIGFSERLAVTCCAAAALGAIAGWTFWAVLAKR